MLVEFASEYASIVGLLSAFSASRNGQKAEDVQSFIEWLIKHNHEELASEIQKNQSTSVFIKAFLNKEIPEIQLKLDSILALVQIVTERLQENPEASLEQDLGYRYAQRIVTFMFERFKHEKFKIENLDYALEITNDLIHGHLKEFNTYVLEAMVRECLTSRISATEIVHKHWDSLVS
ncbi:hypothetical protein [Pseudomonas sp.]|uniref:hypothetical protein n=1 Tax=Pseudomonas sp. TaxID=306 RepID=UPI00299EADAB|nr:hypothetical protein [Pseudomonas sp.]MDX1366812.1 hypothetical protein [Pseudomonas sp.]